MQKLALGKCSHKLCFCNNLVFNFCRTGHLPDFSFLFKDLHFINELVSGNDRAAESDLVNACKVYKFLKKKHFSLSLLQVSGQQVKMDNGVATAGLFLLCPWLKYHLPFFLSFLITFWGACYYCIASL